MACHDVSIGNPCDAGFVLSEPSLYTYSLPMIKKTQTNQAERKEQSGGFVHLSFVQFCETFVEYYM